MVLPLLRCMGGFDVRKTAVQVKRGGGLGQARVAGGDRLVDGRVLGGGGSKPGGVVGGQPADAHEVDAQAAHGLDEVGVGDGGVDGRVQPSDQPVVVVQGRILSADQFRGPEQFAPQRIEGCGVAALGRQGGGPALEGFAQFEQFVDVVQGNVGDD